MYADDTLLMRSAKTSHESVQLCQTMLDNIISWCYKNKLTVNVKKTKSMYINSTGHQVHHDLYINNNALDSVDQFEYLGMHIDNKLSMGKHVEVMMRKARCKFGILCNIRRFISSETCLLLYKVMIRPHLEYGDFIVESSGLVNVEKLELFQNKCLRLAEFQAPEKRKEMSNLKLKYRIEDLKIRRKRSLLRLMYIQSKCDANLCAKKNHIQLRSDGKIKMKSGFTRLTKIQRSPYYRGLGLWNALPEHVQKEPNKCKFKSAVKSLITA